jgi:hypothetical protein
MTLSALVDLRIDKLREAFEAFTIAEVNRHGGIPALFAEEIVLREAIAALLEASRPRETDEPPVTTHTAMCRDLAHLLNRYSQDAAARTPDFLLAELLVEQIATFGKIVRQREHWHGRPA